MWSNQGPVADDPAPPRRYGGKSPAERDAQRRERLLDAGLEVFGTVGYSASTIEALCSTARVATRDFYALFGSKEALLLAVDTRIVDRAGEEIGAALAAAPPDVAARVRAGLHAYARVLADPRRARVHFFEVFAVSADAAGHRRLTGGRLMEIFLAEGRAFMAEGLIPERDLAITSGALLGATRYAMTDWAMRPEAHSVDEVVEELVRLYVSGFAAG
jgi:AcrR family transcriptional regulator